MFYEPFAMVAARTRVHEVESFTGKYACVENSYGGHHTDNTH